jgi:hypothetical protein
MKMNIKFGLIGGGVMGEALLSRLVISGIYQGSEIIVSEPQAERRGYLEQQYGVVVTTDNSLVLGAAKTAVMLAIKPQIFSAVAQELAKNVGPHAYTIIEEMFGFEVIPDSSAGVAVMIQVLDHLLDPVATLRELKTKLLPDSKLLLVTVDYIVIKSTCYYKEVVMTVEFFGLLLSLGVTMHWMGTYQNNGGQDSS